MCYFVLVIFSDFHDCRGNMKTSVEFIRRIGQDPHANGAQSVGCRGCPDIWELEGGDFAVIGIDITDAAVPKLIELELGLPSIGHLLPS